MPPKKKQRFVTAKPGAARNFLEKNFGSFPTNADDVKNGHILYVYMNSGGFSRAECDRQLRTLIKNKLDIHTERCYHADISRIVSSTIKKYRNLQNPQQLQKVELICEKPFTVIRLPQVTQDSLHDKVGGEVSDDAHINRINFRDVSIEPEPSRDLGHASPEPGPSGATPTPYEYAPFTPEAPSTVQSPPDCDTTSSNTRSRRRPFTPDELRLKKRLEFMSKEKKMYKRKIKELKEQLKTPKRVVNQALKRKTDIIDKKKEKIKDLQRQLRGHHLAEELARLKLKLTKSQKAHKKLITYHRNKAKNRKMAPISTYPLLRKKLKERDDAISNLEYENLILKEQVEELQSQIKELQSEEKENIIKMKTNEKTYSSMTRMMVFDHIVNNVPTTNIPPLIEQSQVRAGLKVEKIPQRTAVEMMARELGAISEFQTAATILKSDNVTIGFDATTQEGTHVNSVHFTTEKECCVAAVDELPGGTAADYAEHVMDTVDRLCESYSYFMDTDLQQTRKEIVGRINNSMTDRCAANHAALRIVCSAWRKPLNELNCHLHPLDSFASATRAALKKLEQSEGEADDNDCTAANLILQINKLRYKDGKGDPRGFISFLNRHNLPRCILPRYRGNRLHVLYAISAVLIEHYDLFVDFFKSEIHCGKLPSSFLQDFTDETAKMELHVLGLLGKTLSGPWLKLFYTSAENQINHVEGIQVVRLVLHNLKVAAESPEAFLTAEIDLFGNPLVVDSTMSVLRDGIARDTSMYSMMMESCLKAVIDVIERQYSKYFTLDIAQKLKQETKSARCHNIDAEEVMGMFSAAKKRAPNATLCFLSCRMRAKKNRTVAFIDSLDDDAKEKVLQKAIPFGRKQRDKKKLRHKELKEEIIRRQDDKRQKKSQLQRKDLEKQLKNGQLESALKDFPNISETSVTKLHDILQGRAVGMRVLHVRYEDCGYVAYHGKLEKLRLNKKYKVSYCTLAENGDDATDYEISMFELAADLLHENLILSD